MQIEMKELQELIASVSNGSTQINPFADYVGKNVFIRSVTHHYTGKVEKCVGGQFVEISSAAWIADEGRFSQSLSNSDFSEVEMYPADKPVRIGVAAILDFLEINVLPKSTK